jgi:hypothetical protein
LEINGREIDLRMVIVDQGADTGVWVNHPVASASGPKQYGLPRDVQTLLERAEGQRAVLVAKIKSRAGVAQEIAVKVADEDTWSRLLLLCMAEVDGYLIKQL